MGFLDKIRSVGGGVSPELMKNGTLARGEIASVQPTGMTVSHGNDALGKQVCNIALNVYMDNTPPYTATCHQGVPILALQAFMTPGTVVAVRVNPANPQEVADRLRHRPADSHHGRRRSEPRQCGGAARHRNTRPRGDHREPAARHAQPDIGPGHVRVHGHDPVRRARALPDADGQPGPAGRHPADVPGLESARRR